MDVKRAERAPIYRGATMSEPAVSEPPRAYRERHVLLPAILTGDAVTQLRTRLLGYAAEADVRRILVDCRDVEQLAPYAMTVLIAASRAAGAHGAQLVMVHPNSVVQQALHRLGLDKVLTIVSDDFPPRPWSELQ